MPKIGGIMMKVTCDNCQEDFEPKEKERYLGAMITEKYIICSHCGKKHIITLNNSLTRRLEKEIINIKGILKSSKLKNDIRVIFENQLTNSIEFHKQSMSSLMKWEYSWRYQVK